MKRPIAVPLFLVLIGTTSFLAPAVRADTPDEQYHQASELYNSHLYSTAAQELKRFLDANPTSPSVPTAAFQWAGAVYRTEGTAGVDYPAAIKAYEWALQKYPKAPANILAAARFELGEAYYLSQKPQKAVAVLTGFLQNPGTDAQASTRAGWANYYLGKSYSDLNQPAPARATFETVRSKFAATPAAPDAFLELGLLNLDAGKNAAAITLFSELRAKFPDSQAAPEARVHLGEAQLSAKNYDAARETLRAALNDAKAADFKTDVLQDLAVADFAQKKWDEAAQSYAALLQNLPPDDARRPEVQLQRGNAFFNARNWAAALESYAPLLKSSAKTGAPALYFSASSLSAQSKFAEAAALYRQLLASFPTDALAPKAALRLGDALADAKDISGAAQAYKVVLTRFPGSDSAKAAQGALSDLAGTAGAGEAVESALRDLPASATSNARLRLAQAAFDRGDFSKSAQLASLVADAKPDATTTENALYLVGSAKLNAHDSGAAASAFARQVAAFPKGQLAAQGQLGLAWAFEDQKKWAQSEGAARAALSAGGGNRAQLALANALLNGGKFAPAVAAFAEVEKSSDKTFAAQGAQGSALALEKQNLWREAAAKWNRRAALVSENDAKSRAFLRQGLALGKAKNAAQAQLAFDAAVSASPKSETGAQALYEAAWMAHDLQQSEVERARWTRLEVEFPASKLAPEAVFQGGELALNAKKWDEAATLYARLLEKYPKDELAPRANFGLGTALYNAQKWTEAAAAFDKIGASKEQFSLEAPFWAAESFRKAGNPTEAGPRYARFVKAVEGDANAPAPLKERLPAARLGWGQSLSTPALAAAVYAPALALAKGKTKSELGFRLGEAFTKQEKWAQALPVLLPVATSDNPWRTGAMWLAAQSLEGTGAKADALALYAKLSKMQPSDEWTQKAAARAKELTP